MDKLFEMLEALAQKLGTTVEELGPHVVRHTQIRAIGCLGLLAIVSLIAWPAFFLKARSLWRRDWGKCSEGEAPQLVLPVVIWGIVCFILAVATMSGGPVWVAAAFEPVGATVKMLMGK